MWTTTSAPSRSSLPKHLRLQLNCLCFWVCWVAWPAQRCFTVSLASGDQPLDVDPWGAISVCWAAVLQSTSSAWQCWISTLATFRSGTGVPRENEPRALAVNATADVSKGESMPVWLESTDLVLWTANKMLEKPVNNMSRFFCRFEWFVPPTTYVVFLGWGCNFFFFFLHQYWTNEPNSLILAVTL